MNKIQWVIFGIKEERANQDAQEMKQAMEATKNENL